MIIVKTKDGSKFINEKEAVMVCHDKKAKQVSFHTRETMQGVTINDVESVTYTTDAQPIEWKDEGSEVARLTQSRKEYEMLNAEYKKALLIIKDDLREFAHEMIEIVQHYHDKMPDDVCKRMRSRGEELKSKVNHDDYTKDIEICWRKIAVEGVSWKYI